MVATDEGWFNEGAVIAIWGAYEVSLQLLSESARPELVEGRVTFMVRLAHHERIPWTNK